MNVFGRLRRLFGGGSAPEKATSVLNSTRLPDDWESIQAFSVLIPFEKQHIGILAGTLAEVAKLRDSLQDLCLTRYFPDEARDAVIELTRRDESIPPQLQQYLSTSLRRASAKVAEKSRIILLYDVTRPPLTDAEKSTVSELANKYEQCDVLDFSGDPLVSFPRKAVTRYLRGRSITFSPGDRLSSDRASAVLVDLVST